MHVSTELRKKQNMSRNVNFSSVNLEIFYNVFQKVPSPHFNLKGVFNISFAWILNFYFVKLVKFGL